VFFERCPLSRQTPAGSIPDLARLLQGSPLMPIDARERTVPVTNEPSLDLLFDGFLRQAATRNGGSAPKLRDWLNLAEAWRISHALRECGGNRSAAARVLGIGRRTLYAKMEKLEIVPSFSAAISIRDAEASEGDRPSP
jgi:transcriptional regulator with PAS, ATPase and Fis domain